LRRFALAQLVDAPMVTLFMAAGTSNCVVILAGRHVQPDADCLERRVGLAIITRRPVRIAVAPDTGPALDV
jgi:hypothetical protein